MKVSVRLGIAAVLGLVTRVTVLKSKVFGDLKIVSFDITRWVWEVLLGTYAHTISNPMCFLLLCSPYVKETVGIVNRVDLHSFVNFMGTVIC